MKTLNTFINEGVMPHNIANKLEAIIDSSPFEIRFKIAHEDIKKEADYYIIKTITPISDEDGQLIDVLLKAVKPKKFKIGGVK